MSNRTMTVRLSGEQNHRCAYCGCGMLLHSGRRGSATWDHVKPRSEYGTDDWKNAVAACWECNTTRRSVDAYEFYRYIQKHPEIIIEREQNSFQRQTTIRTRISRMAFLYMKAKTDRRAAFELAELMGIVGA